MAGLQDFRKQHPEYDDMSDSALADALHSKFYADMPRAQFDEKMGLSPAYKEGTESPQWAQRALQYANAIGFGLTPKLLKASGVPEYGKFVSGATEQFTKEHPIESTASEIAGSLVSGELAPLYGLKIGAKVAKTALPITSRVLQTVAPAVAYGGLTSAGQSKEEKPTDIMADALRGAATSGILGAGASGIGSVLGAVGRNVGARLSPKIAATEAQKELSKALYRDVPPGSVFEDLSSPFTPAKRGAVRLETLGPEARVIDVGGENTRRLGDLLATLPGKAGSQFERAIGQRQAGRAQRLVTAADEALGTQGAGYTRTLGALEQQRITASTPFYDQLKGVTVPVDDELFGMLKAAGNEALGKSKRLSRLAGEDATSISSALKDTRDLLTNATIPGKQISFSSLDHVKQALYDLEQRYSRAGEKQEAAAFGNLRKRLTAKLDDLSPVDDAGNSIYRQARDAYAGPSQLADAVENGRSIFSQKPVELSSMIADLSDSEQEAFRIGALQALREKTGTEAGQTSLLKMWKEPATADKLKLVFGNDYRKFAADVAKERQLKSMETVGRGSQTAERVLGAQDLGLPGLDVVSQAAASAKTGDVGNIIAGAKKIASGVSMPEATRNKLAQLLLARGPQAQQELTMLDQIMARANANAAKRAGLAGALAGGAPSYSIFNQE
jgi:hypothetical protein